MLESLESRPKANGPNRQFRKGLWMWSNVIPREDQGEMGIILVIPLVKKGYGLVSA